MLDNKYLIPILIGSLIILCVIIGALTGQKKNNKKENVNIDIEDIVPINDIDLDDQEMTKAEQVGFVNFGDTEDIQYVMNES